VLQYPVLVRRHPRRSGSRKMIYFVLDETQNPQRPTRHALMDEIAFARSILDQSFSILHIENAQ
jgi:hypothetical protein